MKTNPVKQLRKWFISKRDLIESTDATINMLVDKMQNANAHNDRLVARVHAQGEAIKHLTQATTYQDTFIKYIISHHPEVFIRENGFPKGLLALGLAGKELDSAKKALI